MCVSSESNTGGGHCRVFVGRGRHPILRRCPHPPPVDAPSGPHADPPPLSGPRCDAMHRPVARKGPPTARGRWGGRWGCRGPGPRIRWRQPAAGSGHGSGAGGWGSDGGGLKGGWRKGCVARRPPAPLGGLRLRGGEPGGTASSTSHTIPCLGARPTPEVRGGCADVTPPPETNKHHQAGWHHIVRRWRGLGSKCHGRGQMGQNGARWIRCGCAPPEISNPGAPGWRGGPSEGYPVYSHSPPPRWGTMAGTTPLPLPPPPRVTPPPPPDGVGRGRRGRRSRRCRW